MDFGLNDEQRAIRDTVRTFVTREVIPLEEECLRNEREGRVGVDSETLRSLQDKARSAGFWGLNTPEEYGGMGLGPVMTAIITIELGRTLVPFSFGGYADNILYHCTDEQRERYLLPAIAGDRISCFAVTEPGAGSDAKAITTSARNDGDSWVINGEKTFISRGNEADFCMLFAVTDKEKGANGGVTCFLVDREMGWTSSPIQTMGEWGPAALSFVDVRVPEENVLGEVGYGFAYAMEWINAGRFMLPARAVGSCERLLQMATDYANQRSTFGQLLSQRQAIQWMIADSAVEIEAMKLLTLQAAWEIEVGRDNRHSASMAKLYAGVKANEVVDRVLQIHGGMGYTRELPIERWYRELRLLRIYEGTDEIQRQSIARNVLKGNVKIGATPV